MGVFENSRDPSSEMIELPEFNRKTNDDLHFSDSRVVSRPDGRDRRFFSCYGGGSMGRAF